MKHKTKKLLKRLALLMTVPAIAMSGTVGLSAAAKTVFAVSDSDAEDTIAPLNEEYLENGEQSDSGVVPSSLDLSYLSEEAADYQSDTALPSYYDLRDYGRVGAIKPNPH